MGTVSAALDAVLPLSLRGRRGQTAETQAVIDTGFDGFVALARSDITRLELELVGHVDAELGDGSAARLSLFEARVLWHGQERDVHVLEVDGGPLLGTALLRDSQLIVEFVPGGTVSVTLLGSGYV